jgi:hypothetical protein
VSKFDRNGFAQDLEEYRRPGKIDLILDSLDDTDVKIVEGALRDLSISANKIFVALRNQGIDIKTAAPIATWRRHNVAT